MTSEAFATRAMARSDDELLPVVTRALADMDDDARWYEPIVDQAMALYLEHTGRPMQAGQRQLLRRTLKRTKDPNETYGDTAERLARWVSTYLVNAGAAASAEIGDTKTWITRRDDRVRHSHEELDGTTLPLNERFDVAGARLAFPGEPVGDPAAWINCRCILRINQKEIAMTAAVEIAPEIDPADLPAEDPEEAAIDDETLVPFHGVATVVDRPTGDRRQLARDGFSVRPLPLPVFYQRAQGDGHAGSTIVGQFTRMDLNEAGEVEYDGHFNYTPEAAEAIQGVAEGWLRGVSVDLDDIMVDYSRGLTPEQAEGMTPEQLQDAMQSELQVFKQWRVAGLTMVGIPAFHEAFIALGTRAEGEAKKKPKANPTGEAPAEDAPPAPPAKKKDPAAPSGDKEVQPSEKDDKAPPFPSKKKPAKADGETETFAPGTHDGPGWITAPVPTGRIRRYWVHGEGAAKIKWGIPGDFNRCREQLAKYVANPEWLAGTCANMHKEAIGVWPGREDGAHASRDSLLASGMKMAEAFNLVAAATRELPPVAWFQDPGLTAPTPITIEGDHVYGHVATWGTCHIGFGDTCTEAPTSASNYSWFRLGAIETDGGLVPVGQITLGTGHAGLSENARQAAAHYDNTGTAVADIATGEDTYGIWFSGRIRPGVSQDERDALLAAKLSGDWRRIGGSLELVAALAVNTPGFGIPRLSLAASGLEQTALVAAGIVDTDTKPNVVVDPDFDARVRAAVRKVLEHNDRLVSMRVRTEGLAAQVAARRNGKITALRERFAKEN